MIRQKKNLDKPAPIPHLYQTYQGILFKDDRAIK